MKTINEVIAREREAAKESRDNIIAGNNLEPYEAYCNLRCEEYAEEHEQLAEWLEELKAYQRQHIAICEKYGINTIEDLYNKAIDDFAELIHKKLYIYDTIDDLAEQLKVGGENDN